MHFVSLELAGWSFALSRNIFPAALFVLLWPVLDLKLGQFAEREISKNDWVLCLNLVVVFLNHLFGNLCFEDLGGKIFSVTDDLHERGFIV